MRIKIKHGLDIPLSGKPSGSVQTLLKPTHVSLNVEAFEDLRFKLLVKVGEKVKCGQPLLDNKGDSGVFFVSPGAGVVEEIRRGLKRRLLDVVIRLSDEEDFEEIGGMPLSATKEQILSHLARGGIFPHIRMRPFDLVARLNQTPRDIFVNAVESLPCVPTAEMQIEGFFEEFQRGLHVLSKLTSGKVHLVLKEGTTFKPFLEAKGVEIHTIIGPHPSGSHSVHIHHIKPIQGPGDIVWTLRAIDVIAVGKMMLKGRYHYERVLSIAGNGIVEGGQGFFKGRMGYPISSLIAGRILNQLLRLISGDPLTGHQVNQNDFLGFYDTAFTVLPENIQREPFHFLRLGSNKFSAHRAYLSGHMAPPEEGYSFTTNQHGEERAFIDGSVYNKVMPMRIPTMHLIKAILAEDFELAETLGLLEVSSEDFALPAFICPSKIEMVEIVKNGLHRYSKDMGY